MMPTAAVTLRPCPARRVGRPTAPPARTLLRGVVGTRRRGAAWRPPPRAAAVETETDETAETVEIEEYSEDDAQPFTTEEIQSLVSTICEDTKLAEVELKLGGTTLKVHRRMTPPVSAAPAAPAAAAPPPSPVASATLDDSVDEEASMDESTIMIEAPKVGILRRGIYNKAGKRVGNGPGEGEKIKRGQPLCSIEQLGTYVPILAPQQGELVSYVIEDGGPVEYQESVVEMLPYFGGHIIGDKKYA